MRKTGWAFLCGMLLCGTLPCDLALALANDPIASAQAEQSARDQQAAVQYLQIWSKAYVDSGGAAFGSDQPPFDIIAMVHENTALKESIATCTKRAIELRTFAALLGCTNDALKTLATAEGLRDTKLLDSFILAITQLGGDTDAGTLSRTDAARLYGILANVFDRATFFEFVHYLDRQARVGEETAPYDIVALTAAGPTFRQARTDCDSATADKDGAATVTCLLDNDTRLSIAGKIQDKTIGDITRPLLRKAAVEKDAGRISHADLLGLHDYLLTATLAALDIRYGAYLNHFYSTLFENNYATAQAAHGKYVPDKPANEESAATAAHDTLDSALAACAVPGAFASSAAYVACRMDATRAFITVTKLRDTYLFDAYADTGRTIAADTDAGKMTPAQRDSALSALADQYDVIFQQEDKDYHARADKPLIEAYVARFDKAYADAIALHGPLAPDSPPYDPAMIEAANATQARALDQCEAKHVQLKTHLAVENCYLDVGHVYSLAIKQKDQNLEDTYIAAEQSAAADSDTGKIPDSQVGAVYAAISAEDDKILAKEMREYQARINKPVIDAYLARFDKAYADAITAHPLNPDLPAYDTAATTGAAAERDKATDLCEARRATLKTHRALEACYLDANHIYALAAKMQDKALLDNYTAIQLAAAADADNGTLTADQMSAIANAVSDDYADKLNGEQSAYQTRADKPIVDGYVARFNKAYADAKAATPDRRGTPEYEVHDDADALAARAKAQAQCDAGREAFKTVTAWIQCRIEASKIYELTRKMHDTAVMDSYMATQTGAASDADAGKLTSEKMTAVINALAAAYYDTVSRQQSDYEARRDKPVIDAYVARFAKAYADAIAAHPLSPETPPYDAAAIPGALADRKKATDLCESRRTTFKTRRAFEDCYLDANRAYYSTIKMRDNSLLDSYIASQQGVADDADAGKITSAQETVTLTAISTEENNRLNKEFSDYQARVYKPLIDAYVARFEKAYTDVRAAQGPVNSGAPPYDVAADKEASAARAKSFAACDARALELKTKAARLECRLNANRVYLAAIKIRDTLLFGAWAAALREAAADTDAGKISSVQWDAIAAALDQDYNRARSDAVTRYQLGQPLVAAHVRDFDNDYLVARRAAGPLAAGAPYDIAASQGAGDVYGLAVRDCADRREALKTSVGWAACVNEADHIRAATAKLRDTILVEKYEEALRRAAVEVDAGKISREQLMAIAAGLTRTYNVIIADEMQAWKVRTGAK